MLIIMQIQEHCQQPATADETSHDALEDLSNCAKKLDVKTGILVSELQILQGADSAWCDQ
jgi:hypothetical protein